MDGDDEGPTLVPRIDFIKCRTAHCQHNLGVRMPHGKVYWHVPVIVDFASQTTQIECPVCHTSRTWTHKRK